MGHTKQSISNLCQKHIRISKKGLSAQYNNTESCQSFYNGDMMTYEDRIQFTDAGGRRRRATVNFNKVQSNVDAVVGFMAQNRRQAKFIARLKASAGQQLYSKNMNAIYTYHRENTNADQLETEQDADMMINGYGAIETDLSYIMGNATVTPNGDIIKRKLSTKACYWDPNARGSNLLDAKWAGYYEDYDLTDALNLLQGSSEDDFQRVGDINSDDDTGYVYNPYGGLFDKIKMEDSVEWTSKEQEMVRVYNHQWSEYETYYKAANPLYTVDNPVDALFIKARLELIQSEIKSYAPSGINAGDMFDFDPSKEELIFDAATKSKLVKEFGKLIEPIPMTRTCFYTAVVSGKHVFSWFKSVCQQGFSIKFKTGVFSEQGKVWMGMVNAMMEPAKYYNKAVTEFMFTVAAMSKGGVMIEESAVEDISDFESKWAKTDAVIKVNDGALAAGKIQQKTQAAMPNGIDTIITLSDAAISANGVDPAFLGDITGQESGVLYKRRIRQVISKMARYFDSITLYQKEDARLSADLIRVWVQNNAGAVVRITGEDGADDFFELSMDALAPEYDVSIQEAPQSSEDKQETAQIIGMYGDKIMTFNPTAGQAFYAESIKMLPIDGDVVNILTKALQPQENVPMQQYQAVLQELEQLKGQAAQLEMQKVQSEIALNAARTSKEQASTVDTLEAAATKGHENDIMRTGQYSEAKVSI